MKKSIKITSMAMALALSVSTAVGLVGCNKQPEDTADALDIYILHKGNGVQWCYDMADAFIAEDWVKEKYPNLTINPIVTNDIESYGSGQLNAGEGRNRFDLMFVHLDGQTYAAQGELEDLTQSVYYSTVPGEEQLYIAKHNDSYTFMNRYIDTTNANAEAYYQTTWNHGMNSFVYNETLLTELGYEVPNTTDEFLKICDEVLNRTESQVNGSTYKHSYTIRQAENGYWNYTFPIFWAQYEGIAEYTNFWKGIVDGRYSREIFQQDGIEKSLEFLETALDYETGYFYTGSRADNFMAGQTAFLLGEGIFHSNGDWFDNEMRSVIQKIQAGELSGLGNVTPSQAEAAKNYVFKIMRTPIISALGTKLGIDDATLSAIVEYVDDETGTIAQPVIAVGSNGLTSTGYTADEVIAAVTEARTVVHSLGPKHAGIIPSYAKCKGPAIDFLRFMATDKAQEIYMRATGGSCLPFEYNVKEENPTLYNDMTPFHQAKLDYFCSSKYDVYTLPDDGAFPLAQYGGVTATVDVQYYTTFTTRGNTKTAAQFVADTVNYWSQSKFEEALATAGLN